MNIIDIVLLLLLFSSILFGMYRGSVASLWGLAASLVAFPLTFLIAPHIAAWLGANRGVMELLSTYTDANALVGDYTLATTAVQGISQSALQAVINSLTLPQSILGILESNMSQCVFASSGLVTVNDYVAYTIVAVSLKAVCFAGTYALCAIALHFAITLINHVFRFPVLKHFDGLVGGVFGLLRGMLILYVLSLLFPIVLTIIPVNLVKTLFDQSTLATVFSSSGFFIRVVTGS
ncbi:MAG: CvpA family protein [Clostridia bacterium]|nr:CvpA family protein [Clostridia bacterium]